jgi:hypothetical protein
MKFSMPALCREKIKRLNTESPAILRLNKNRVPSFDGTVLMMAVFGGVIIKSDYYCSVN